MSLAHRLAIAPAIAASVVAGGGCAPAVQGAEGDPVAVLFAARVGDEPFSCGATFAGLGTTGTTLTPVDLRLLVHDVRLVDDSGAEVAVTLDDDGVAQDGTVALVDFEDGTGPCAQQGTPGTHTAVTGTVARTPRAFSGVRFTLGVPFAHNHQDPAVAAPPLNDTSLSWNWQGGFKFLKLDARTTGLPGGLFVHVGSTGCDGDPVTGGVTTCSSPNRVDVALDGFDPTRAPVTFDLQALLSGNDLDVDAGGAPGCMASLVDPECPAIFDRLGLPGGTTPTPRPSVFVAP
jgi:uncharacterized repeat protein (TIGR04052 family)